MLFVYDSCQMILKYCAYNAHNLRLGEVQNEYFTSKKDACCAALRSWRYG